MEEGVSLQSRRALLKQFAPQYRTASSANKRVLLDAFAQATGYHRGSGMWLLNHAEEVLHPPVYRRQCQYGPDVQHALFLAWHAANRSCAKRLVPFLPILIDCLERHEHLHLTQECRSFLLSMSAATADRLLRSQRKLGQYGLSATRAGTVLKQQMPIRTFAEWNETRPGLTSSGSGGPLWHQQRGRLPVHVDAHRYRHGMDGMSTPAEPESGDGAGGHPTSAHALPLSDPGN
jgi:hypothetical protein